MTQKSESVREAEQVEKEWLNSAEIAKLRWHWADPLQKISREDQLALLLAAYAKSVTLKLAEEAEQQAGEIQNYQEWTWSNVAAWLREKAR